MGWWFRHVTDGNISARQEVETHGARKTLHGCRRGIAVVHGSVCGWGYGRCHSCGVTNNQEYARVREELPGVAAYGVCCGSMPLALVDQNVL